MKDKIYIVGTGGFACEVLCLIDDLGDYERVAGFLELDDIWKDKWQGKNLMGKEIVPFSSFQPDLGLVSIGIGDPKIREKTVGQLPENTKFISLIHPRALVSRWVKLGVGAVVTAGCVLTSNIEIGDHVHLNLDTTIGHDCKIGNFFTTAPSVNVSGNCTISNRVYLGTGSATRQGLTITNDVVLGMGAMAVKDMKEPGIYVGIPAKKR